MKRLLLGILLLGISPAFAVQKAVVIVPVADLRSDKSLPPVGHSDDKQLTQLLFGETVNVVKTEGDWAYVNAIEQPEFTTHQKWEGYPGWVLLKAFHRGKGSKPVRSFPATLLPQRSPNLRDGILQSASLLLGDPYVWGGLSPYDPKLRLTGIDCSGLTHLAYRVNGITIPRDSMEQYMKVEKIKRDQLKPADLIFSSKADHPQKITHVALYAGENEIIEAPQTGMVVRKVSFKEKYGQDLKKVESGDRVGDRYIYFGRFLKD